MTFMVFDAQICALALYNYDVIETGTFDYGDLKKKWRVEMVAFIRFYVKYMMLFSITTCMRYELDTYLLCFLNRN
jgi:hypothetical protein